MPEHILTSFDDELLGLRSKVFKMISLARKNLDSSMRGLLERNQDLCNDAIVSDQDVNQLEKDIDNAGMEILIRFQPAAHDLREIMGTLRVANNVERIADQASSIAKRAREMNKMPEVAEVRTIQPLFQLCLANIDESFGALQSGDVERAEKARLLDKKLDEDEKEFARGMVEAMAKNSAPIEVCLHLIFIARFLERVGDHGKNICEDTIFIEEAKDVRYRKDKLTEIK